MDTRKIGSGDLWLAGVVLGGALVKDWCGPHSCISEGTHGGGTVLTNPEDFRLDCTRPEVRDRIVRTLMAGERCGGRGSLRPFGPTAGVEMHCSTCNGSGHTRPPHDLLWVTAAELRGEITPTEAAGILWVSALRVAVGLEPVRDLLRTSRPSARAAGWFERCGLTGHAVVSWSAADCCGREAGWWFSSPFGHDSGRGIGEGGRRAAESAVLSAGYALREPDGLLLPHPTGPVLLETP